MAIKASGVPGAFFLALHTLLIRIKAMEKKELYSDLLLSLKSLIEEAPNEISVFSNASALLFMSLDDLNWAGFYFLDEKAEELFLGPFQGKVACQTIMVGRGVCGTSVKEERTLRVDDVHKFKGHIACDAASRSEIVIPIRKNGRIIGVLDIDSPILNRFDEEDQEGLESFVKEIEKRLTLPFTCKSALFD